MISNLIISYIYDKRFVYQLIGTLATYFSIKIVKFISFRKDRYKIFREYGIPGPEPSIFGGSLDDYLKYEARFRYDEQLRRKYGGLYGVYFGDEPSVIITELDTLKKCFFDEQNAFTERSRVFIESPATYGILFAKHPRWKVMRKAMSPLFSTYIMRGSSATQFLEDSVKLMIDYIENKLEEAQLNKTKANLDIQDLMKATALHLISMMALKLPDVQVKEQEKYVKSLDQYLSVSDRGIVVWAVRFPFVRSIVQFLADHFEHSKMLSEVNRRVGSIIDNDLMKLSYSKVHERERQDQVIDVLIKLHHEGKLTRTEVMGNVEALLFAGYDTTSTTLAYIFWVLAKHPEIQNHLREDLMSNGMDSKYLTQVINETMRLYPTVTSFTTRIATKTVEVNGWTLPKGTRIVYNAWLMHRHPDIWPEPEKFDPRRFCDDAISRIHPCAFAPFGLADRRCLGYQLAMLELKMIACDVILRYKLALNSPQNLELVTYAGSLTKSKEKIMIDLEKL